MPPKDSDICVAAILATMNRPEYVRGAIASACEQTHESMEVVVIDDSDDRQTEAVVDELRQTYSDVPITYLHNDTPQGLPAARNQGVAATDARFLAFLDDDDRWNPEKTSRQLSLFRSGPDDLALVHSGYVGRYEDGRHKSTVTPEYDHPAYPRILEENFIGTPSTVMIERDAFEDVSGFDETIRFCEDWDLYIRIARNYRCAYVTEPLIERTYHDDAMIEDLEPFFKYRKRLLEKYEEERQRHDFSERAWTTHYRLVGRKHLEAGNRRRARDAYRVAWSMTNDVDFAVMCVLLYALPIRFALPTMQKIGKAKSRLDRRLEQGFRSSSA